MNLVSRQAITSIKACSKVYLPETIIKSAEKSKNLSKICLSPIVSLGIKAIGILHFLSYSALLCAYAGARIAKL